MKRLLLSSIVLTLIAVGLPLLMQGADKTAPQPVQTHYTAEKLDGDAKRKITVLKGGEKVEMTVGYYITGVVAAEMPVSFEPEALKAQAVAARTYLQRSLNNPRHDGADICTDSDCCQAYLSKDALREKWGDKFDEYYKKIEKAVNDTDGEYLSYEGEAVLAAFHSSSAGVTENSGAVWSELPYLVSVDTPEGSNDVPQYESRLSLYDIDFRDTILYAKYDADMTGEADSWISEVKRTASGRVESMTIGGKLFTGAELRKLFSLRSTAFDITHADGKFEFTVTGYGHGVGMSQYGANVMAKSGAGYRDILAHYYPGTELQ